MLLSELKNGEKAYITSIEAPTALKNRMYDLGVLPGEEAECIYSTPLGSPVVFRIMGQSVSLRRREAACISVSSECPETSDSTEYQKEGNSCIEFIPSRNTKGCGCASCCDSSCPSCTGHHSGTIAEGDLTIALVGNPNCGKTAFFNAASGGHEHTGNYAGVTVSRTIGHMNLDGRGISLVDLPGTYSLQSTSPDEAYVLHELTEGTIDVIVNVIDSGNLERSLMLTCQLLKLGKPMICVLNMFDEFSRSGGTIDLESLQGRLGVPCMTSVARHGEGVMQALRTAVSLAGEETEPREEKITPKSVLRGIYSKSGKVDRATAFMDSFTAHGPLAYLTFILVMAATFYLTFTLGAYPMDWIDAGVGLLGDFLSGTMPEGILRDVLVDGILGGVGSVIVFLPNILILYLCISLLEDSGYLVRAAMMADPLFERLGLHGKSFIPMLMGFGCNVPAVMATRTIDNRKTRIITMLTVPFMSCSARLPVYVVFCGAFFPDYAALVMTLLYFGGIAVALLMAWIMGKLYRRNVAESFVMEVPPYRIPYAVSVFRHTWEKGRQYLHKMSSVILIASIVIWALGYFPVGNGAMSRSEQQEQSYLGKIGKAMEPVFAPLGFDWRMNVGILAGTGAKELMVSSLGVLYDCPDEDAEAETAGESGGTRLSQALRQEYTPMTALAYMIFALLYFPCIATVTAIGAESGKKSMAFFTALYTTGIAYLIAWLSTVLFPLIG
ncbi:MAG: ferrous iron transport protein B [Bacteroidales bacterium]|nr:ferrous iron transport protein B [Bacteroidales bacterium]